LGQCNCQSFSKYPSHDTSLRQTKDFRELRVCIERELTLHLFAKNLSLH
jgi:hypothetical protein